MSKQETLELVVFQLKAKLEMLTEELRLARARAEEAHVKVEVLKAMQFQEPRSHPVDYTMGAQHIPGSLGTAVSKLPGVNVAESKQDKVQRISEKEDVESFGRGRLMDLGDVFSKDPLHPDYDELQYQEEDELADASQSNAVGSGDDIRESA